MLSQLHTGFSAHRVTEEHAKTARCDITRTKLIALASWKAAVDGRRNAIAGLCWLKLVSLRWADFWEYRDYFAD